MSDGPHSPEFLNVLAHELRAPLFPIIALTDLMLSSGDEEIASGAWRDHMQMIGDSGQQLLALVTDLMELSRAESGKKRLTPATLRLEPFVFGLQKQHEGGPHPVQVVLSDHDVDEVVVDPALLDRIAAGLIAHAIDDCDDEIRLHVGADKDTVTLSIDTPAMSDAERAGVFAPFWCRQSEGPPRARGIGLTLPLVQRMADLHGGSVAALATDAGTRLRVQLPALSRAST